MFAIKKSLSLRNVFSAALMLGISATVAGAQVYEMRGSGGGTEGAYSSLELPYPNGDTRRILYPFDYGSVARHTDEEKQALRERMILILRDYVENIMPQMPAIYEADFGFVISVLSGSLGVDELMLCQDVGYDCDRMAMRVAGYSVNHFAYLHQDLNTAYKRGGYRIVPSAMYIDESSIDEINGLLAELRANYPNDPSYQIPDYTVDFLYQQRRELAQALALTMVQFKSDVVFGALDVNNLTRDQQDYLSMMARVLSEPENMDNRDFSNANSYNGVMSGYIDQILEQQYFMAEVERNELYQLVFRVRDTYDYRSLPRENDFLAGRDVISAPQP